MYGSSFLSPNAETMGAIVPSPSSTQFERSMGALVSNFKEVVGYDFFDEVDTPIPNPFQSAPSPLPAPTGPYSAVPNGFTDFFDFFPNMGNAQSSFTPNSTHASPNSTPLSQPLSLQNSFRTSRRISVSYDSADVGMSLVGTRNANFESSKPSLLPQAQKRTRESQSPDPSITSKRPATSSRPESPQRHPPRISHEQTGDIFAARFPNSQSPSQPKPRGIDASNTAQSKNVTSEPTVGHQTEPSSTVPKSQTEEQLPIEEPQSERSEQIHRQQQQIQQQQEQIQNQLRQLERQKQQLQQQQYEFSQREQLTQQQQEKSSTTLNRSDSSMFGQRPNVDVNSLQPLSINQSTPSTFDIMAEFDSTGQNKPSPSFFAQSQFMNFGASPMLSQLEPSKSVAPPAPQTRGSGQQLNLDQPPTTGLDLGAMQLGMQSDPNNPVPLFGASGELIAPLELAPEYRDANTDFIVDDFMERMGAAQAGMPSVAGTPSAGYVDIEDFSSSFGNLEPPKYMDFHPDMLLLGIPGHPPFHFQTQPDLIAVTGVSQQPPPTIVLDNGYIDPSTGVQPTHFVMGPPPPRVPPQLNVNGVPFVPIVPQPQLQMLPGAPPGAPAMFVRPGMPLLSQTPLSVPTLKSHAGNTQPTSGASTVPLLSQAYTQGAMGGTPRSSPTVAPQPRPPTSTQTANSPQPQSIRPAPPPNATFVPVTRPATLLPARPLGPVPLVRAPVSGGVPGAPVIRAVAPIPTQQPPQPRPGATPTPGINGPGTYVCQIQGCGRAFPKLPMLQSHMATHSGSVPTASQVVHSPSDGGGSGKTKPFKCEICPQTFSRSHDLKRHNYIHTQEKPYVCLRCGKGFSRRDALRRHERSVNEGKKVHCVVPVGGVPNPTDGDEEDEEGLGGVDEDDEGGTPSAPAGSGGGGPMMMGFVQGGSVTPMGGP